MVVGLSKKHSSLEKVKGVPPSFFVSNRDVPIVGSILSMEKHLSMFYAENYADTDNAIKVVNQTSMSDKMISLEVTDRRHYMTKNR